MTRACCMLTLIWNLLKKPSGELLKVPDWLNANKLMLNAKKSNYVIFRPYQRKLNYSVNIEMIDNCTRIPTTLQCEDHVKYLGVLLDSNLSWKFQINNVALKISRTVGVVAHLRHFVPRTTLLNIYQSLILPYLTYGLAAWGQPAKTPLQKILAFVWCIFLNLSTLTNVICWKSIFYNVWRLLHECSV